MGTSNFDQSNFEEHKLIILLKEDSEYAFQLIFDKHRNRIYKTAIKFLKSPIIAQDVVQDVFLKLWFERNNLNENKPIEAWLYTVAKHNILNKLRKIANDWKAVDQYANQITYEDNKTDHKLIDGQYQSHLSKAVSKLPEQQKLVFLLSRNDKLTYDQIGQKLGISPLTVKTHLSRALHFLKKELKTGGILVFSMIFNFF
jgi:RNA polymerase sigma-70 factor (ECF subfamily)